MSFRSGRVSFMRFLVNGDLAKLADDGMLAQLSGQAFTESTIGRPSEIEAGWVTGEHLLDVDFTYEKNIFGEPAGSLLLLGMRIDTHKVPADVKRAYQTINEQTLAANNPSGNISKAQKKEAKDLTDRQLHEDLASGRFRNSKMVPVMWDLQNRTAYIGAASNAAAEQFASLMFRTFEVEIEPLSAGSLAERFMEDRGLRRDFEDLRPSQFTAPPAAATADHDDAGEPRDVNTPAVPWTYAGGNTRDFLGNEFLIWLWWNIDANEGLVAIRDESGRPRDIAVIIDKAMDMDCAWKVTGRQSLRGDGPGRWPEAAEGLAVGKWPRKAGLIAADPRDGSQFDLSLQADRMLIGSAAIPEIKEVTSRREMIDARLGSTLQLTAMIDGLFHCYLEERTASTWSNKLQSIKSWIGSRRRKTQTVPIEQSEPSEPEIYSGSEDVIARL